ncbi:expressed unknown protein [Seminavis robusta]|uniref:Uncharacterized protein n=1 Tax=Seminavis robusta TaxID=568900 RepID=A0A9N8HZV1_9STRA|nr:expressed unknown protein [Seminavis robusta]|eukprot:Sro2394_g325920.1 n/a (102) ;mRNA; r:13951-14256
MNGNYHSHLSSSACPSGRLSPHPHSHNQFPSYQDLKEAFLNTEDIMGGMAAQQVFQKVEEVVEEMVQDILLEGTGVEDQEMASDQAVPEEAAMGLLLLLKG